MVFDQYTYNEENSLTMYSMKKFRFNISAAFLGMGLLVFLGAGCGEENQETVSLNQTVPVVQMDNKKEQTEEENMDTADVVNEKEYAVEGAPEAESLTYDYQADLEPNLAGAATGEESGKAYATFQDDLYTLHATFENLPEIDSEEYFYEGWLVAPGSVITTGNATLDENDQYVNTLQDTRDLTNYTRYILTLEPRDGDPAPADHVVEGDLVAGEFTVEK